MNKELLWRLFKSTGKIEYYMKYKVIYIGKDSETLEEMVIYSHNNQIWVRSYNMFNSLVDKSKYPNIKQKYRFEEIG